MEIEMVDDEYWLNYAKQGVDTSISTYNSGAATLQDLVKWFWGLYTLYFVIGVTINMIDAPLWIIIVLGSPVSTLLITYFICVWTQMPVQVSFSPTIPDEIRSAYQMTVKIKSRRFKYAIAGTLISTILLATALTSLSFVDKKVESGIEASLSENKEFIVIYGTLPDKTLVAVTLDSISVIGDNICKTQFYKFDYVIPQNKVLNLVVPIKMKGKDIFVNVVWNEDGKSKGYTQNIKLN